ncbi:MAG: hypothetical protein E6G00_11585 [Actinobacteria bacterium]|nr:MAG: hypothetical protein E6G00_11585 [Actinomycetota bacterium]
MSHVFDHRLSPATIIALLALFVALGAMLASPEFASAANGDNITATEGASFTKRVADIDCTFNNATINWGDGTSSAGEADTSFGIKGTHTYLEEGTYDGSVTYQDDCTANGSLTFTATVADATLNASGRDVHATAGQSFTGVVAHFTDADPNGTASDYSAQINWGDGTTSAGTISPAMGGGFDVSGTQTYSSPGQKAVQVTIQDLGGSMGYSNSTATVAPARPIALINAPPATASIFALHQKVSMRFSCREGLGGPGLQSCVACPSTSRPSGAGCVSSGRTFAGAVRLNTATLGQHSYTVTARSRDGQRASATLRYTVARHRPLVFAPPSLVALARRPCVLYRCRRNPAPHAAWENELRGLQTNFCGAYPRGCTSPMDLVPTNGFDDNMFPFNPDWASFVLTGHPPDATQLCSYFVRLSCTSQPVGLDQAGSEPSYDVCLRGRKDSLGFRGHVNWEPATYEGTLQWEEHAPPGADDEYSLQLYPFNLDGATTGNAGGDSVHIEFDSDETIDHFDDDLWWKEFHDIVDNSHPHVFIDGALAEVTGLAGIDTVHTPGTELHPVYGIAIEDKAAGHSVQRDGNDLWTFFARNWGNEGYCSDLEHGINVRKITVRIPWLYSARGKTLAQQPRPATDVKVRGGSADYMNIDDSHAGVSVRKLPGEGVLLTFNLEAPESQSEYWGHIYLKWIFGQPNSVAVAAGLPPGSPMNRVPIRGLPHPLVGAEGHDVERLAGKLWRRLPTAVRRRALAQVPKLAIRRGHVGKVRFVRRPPPRVPLVADALFFRSPFYTALLAREHAERRALCHAYRNHVPRFPRMCRKNKHHH